MGKKTKEAQPSVRPLPLFLRRFWIDRRDMSITGTVKDGVVVLPEGMTLPEGAAVNVEVLEISPAEDALAKAMLKLAKPRPHLPPDYALNHGHYLRGEPKK